MAAHRAHATYRYEKCGPASAASQPAGALWLVIVALALPLHAAMAEQAGHDAPRYRVEAQLRPEQARYALAAELRSTSPPRHSAARFTLKQPKTADAVCEELGDAIFTDQFE